MALALCAQAPPSTTVTGPDGAVYRVTFTPIAAGEGVPPPPQLGTPRASASAQSVGLAMPQPPAKSQPQPVAMRYATPQVTLQYQYQQPATTALAVQTVSMTVNQPMATVSVKQPCMLDRAIARVGLMMYQRGNPRLRVTPAPASLALVPSASVPMMHQTYASAQQ
jgi:hypothetical protein